MIRAIIIDDIEIQRNHLRNIIEKELSDVLEIKDTTNNILDGIRLIKLHKPDLVFLDIELPPLGTGFDLLAALGEDNIDFDVIFTTQFDQFAIRAIKFGAVDYLLKPIDIKELKSTIEKYQKCLLKKINLEVVQQHIQSPDNPENSIMLRNLNSIPINVKLKNIIRCEGDVNYTKLYLHNRIIETSETLKVYEEMLGNYDFFMRIHKSHLANLLHVKKVVYCNAKDGGKIIMSDGSTVEISRRKASEFLERYAHFRK